MADLDHSTEPAFMEFCVKNEAMEACRARQKALLVHGGIQIALLFWIPTEEETIVFYVIALLWGMGDAVIQTQINAFYGYLFTEKPEAAFASYRICENMGFIIAFGYSSFLCTDIKLYVCLAFLVVGMILYGVVEVLQRRNIKQTVSAES